MPLRPWIDFSSGYFQRAMDQLPRQGAKKPWKLNQNYLADLMSLRFARVGRRGDALLGLTCSTCLETPQPLAASP